MAHKASAEGLVSIDSARKGLWGAIHELGDHDIKHYSVSLPYTECAIALTLFVFLIFLHPGYMHCGYPVMAHRESAGALVNAARNEHKDLWGSIHELGHNQQRGCWEFPSHTTECTCNLWSVYVHEEVLGIDRAQVE